MSGSRGRKSSSHIPEYSSRQSYTNPRWPGHQQQYCDQNSSLQRGWPNNSGWNVPQGYHGWPASNPNVQVWPQPHYQHSGHQRAGGDTFQFNPYPQRFTNAYNPPYAHFTERSLAYLNQTPLNELTRGGHRDSSSHRGSASSVNIQHNTAKNERLNAQNERSKEVPHATTSRSGIPSNHEKSNTLKSPASINIPEKPASVPAQTTSFMPPNDDLRNKVKASLKMMAATKDQVPTKKTSPATSEPIVPSSPQRQRESRVPSAEGTSPSTRHGIRVAAGSHRRISQSSTSSNPAANDGSLLEGIGFIQSTSADNNISDQAPKVGNASTSSGGDGQAQESDPVTTISKDQLNRYIRTMDNHQRRQLVEQPRANISQYMLNHLVQENQTARARQLTSLRFRVSSTELEMTSKTDTHVVLCDELVEQIKELLAQDNEEPVTTLQKSKQMPEPEEEEIQVLEPPPKTPPLCIDLDLDDQPAATAASLSSLPPTSSQQTREQPSSVKASINGARTDNSSKSTPTVPAREVPFQPSESTITRNSSLASVAVSSVGRRSNNLSTQAPAVPKTSEVPPLIPVSSSLGLPMTAEEKAAHRKSEKKKRKQEKLKLFAEERRAKQKQGDNQKAKTKKSEDKAKKEAGKLANMQGTLMGNSAKQKEVDLKSKKQKKKKNQTPTKSPPMSIPATASNFLQTPVPIPVQTPVPIPAQMLEATAEKGTVKVPAPEEIQIDSLPNAGHPRSALKFLLQDLQIEEQQGKSRITVIDSTIEALLLERKFLTDRVLALKQRQFDLLSSSLTNTQFESDVPNVSSISQTSKDEPVAAEPVKAADGDVVVPPSPTGASTQLLTLMHQLEENGVQVALGELEHESPTDSVASTVSSTSVGTKRKRIAGDEVSQLKRKTTPSNSPSRNALSIQDATVTVVPASVNPPTVQSLLASDTPVLAQTLSPRTTAVSSVSVQSVGSSVPTKTHTTVSSETGPTSSSEPSVPVESQTRRTSVTKEPEALPSATKPVEPNSMLAGIPEETAVDNSVTKKPAENWTDGATSSLQNASQKNSPLLPTHQLARNTIPRNSPVLPTPQATPVAPEKLPQVVDPKKVPQSNTLVSKEAASADQPSVGTSGDLVFLPSHTTSVRCCFVNGPCIFTASEDGTVHVYDMATRTLSMRIRGHENPVTWLYAVSLNTPSDKLRTLNAAEYLNQLNLITGSEDTYVRQFSLETGRLLHEKECSDALTCVAGHKLLGKLFIGSKEGHIFTYAPKANVLRTTSFRATAEVICLKVARVRDQKAIIVAARRMDPVVYNLETEEAIFTLSSNIPNSSFYCMSTSANFVYCCDANKNVFTFNMLNSRSPLCQTETLPSAAVNCYHDGNRYLILGCIDGVIRVLDLLNKSTTRLFVMPGQHVKTLTCMKVSGDKIVLGSLAGEVAYRCITDLEAMSKIQESF